jgi:hypothetical protein
MKQFHLVGRWSCVEASIQSIRLDDQPAEGIGALGGTLEIGIAATALPKRSVELYADTLE